MRAPSRVKCSCHGSILGLKNRTNAPVDREMAPTSVPLARLQRAQENARLNKSVMPPCLRLMTWSTSQPASSAHSGIRQYSQRLPARAAPPRRNPGLPLSAMLTGQTCLGFGQHQQVLQLQVIVELHFLLWQQPELLLFLNQRPDALPRRFGGMAIRPCLGGDMAHQEIQHFVARVHSRKVTGTKPPSKPKLQPFKCHLEETPPPLPSESGSPSRAHGLVLFSSATGSRSEEHMSELQ